MPALLTLEGVTKTYPGVKALQDVSFSVEPATVHAVMGENGAGKSTLMQVIAGAHRPTSGRLVFDGAELDLSSTRDAAAEGIAIVFQELMLAPNMTVAENIGLGTEPRQARVLVDRAAPRTRARVALDRLGVGIDPDTRLGDLTIAQQRLVEIAKALTHEPRVLILDEPTRGVDVGTKAKIYALMRELAREGLAILVISSDLPEVVTRSDRILVMRSGRLAGEIPFAEASEERIMALAALEHPDPAHPSHSPQGYADAAAQ